MGGTRFPDLGKVVLPISMRVITLLSYYDLPCCSVAHLLNAQTFSVAA